MEQLEKYLKPTFTIDSDSKPIREKISELTQDQEDIISKAKSLFYFVRDQIKFTMYVQIDPEEHYKASTTLQKGEGYCVQKAVLLTALARASGIPARLGFADFINHRLAQKYLELQGTNLTVYDGFAELYLNGRWIKATPAYDLDMCNKYRFIPVDFDGEHDATFHQLDQDGKPHVEYVRFHGSFQDLPHTEIINATKKAYGQGFIKFWYETAQRNPPTSS